MKLHGGEFGVRNSTGVVFVRGLIDYEQTSVYHLIVIARDRGPDAVASETTVVVHVQDANDNSPVVLASTLQHSGTGTAGGGVLSGAGGPAVADVLEDSPADTFVAHVSVSDADTGKNGRVNCTMVGGGTAFRLIQKYDTEYQVFTTLRILKLKLKLKFNKALDENSSLSYGSSPYGITQCYLPPDTSERAPS